MRLQLISMVLEDRPQLLWKCYLRGETKFLEQQGKAKGFENFQDQILDGGHCSNTQEQACYNECILSLCNTTALNAWDRIQEWGKRIKSYFGLNRVRENSLVTSYKDYQRLYKWEWQALKLYLHLLNLWLFENANLKCKKILGPLNVR